MYVIYLSVLERTNDVFNKLGVNSFRRSFHFEHLSIFGKIRFGEHASRLIEQWLQIFVSVGVMSNDQLADIGR